MNIYTNHHWREFIYGYELTEKERADFDYIEDIETHYFIKYGGAIYDASEFLVIDQTMRLHADFGNWQGYQSESFYSGLLIKYSEDCEQYQIARYAT